jgi:hypothetical protein
MLSLIEGVFVRILRGTVVTTASAAILIAVGALIYAGYAHFLPEPQANLSGRVSEYRQATDPARLILAIFPPDSSVYKEIAATPDNISYESNAASDEMIFDQLNEFLNAVFGASFESKTRFSEWLYGGNKIQLSWSDIIDERNVSKENGVNYLSRSLLLDYARRLAFRAAPLGKARKQNLYADSFDRLTAPTGRSRAPYFLVWYFEHLQERLQSTTDRLTQARAERDALRLTEFPAIVTALSAFGYFIAIIFCFLLISIEASLRKVAEAHQTVQPKLADAERPTAHQAP